MRRTLASLLVAVLVLGAFALEGRAALRSQSAQLGRSRSFSPAAWDVPPRSAGPVRLRVTPFQLVATRDPGRPLIRE
jgi:hypothetical protein